MKAQFIDLNAAADFLGPGAIEVNRYQTEIFDIVRRRGVFGQRAKQVPATGHPSRFFEETSINSPSATQAFVDPRNITATVGQPTRVERTVPLKALVSQINYNLFDLEVGAQQSQFAYLQAKDLADSVEGLLRTHDVALWNGNDTSLSNPTTLQYMGAIAQIEGGGNTTTISTTSSIVDGFKSTIAQMVSNSSYNVRPTAIYANPVLLDLIDREMKTEYNVVLQTEEITAGLTVKMLSTQAGNLPLIPEWAIGYTGMRRRGHSGLVGMTRLSVGVIMKLLIDNFDGNGPHDYTSAVEPGARLVITRKLNQPTKLVAALVTNGAGFVVPANGGRITLVLEDGEFLFTGYLTASPQLEYLGLGVYGATYRVHVSASSDEVLLEDKRLPACAPFVNRSAGSALQRLTQNILPGAFDLSAAQNVDTIVDHTSDPQKTWSVQAAEIAVQTRAVYQLSNGALSLVASGTTAHNLNESDTTFAPEGLTIIPANSLANDITVVGDEEPQAYVTDYFIGDGLTLRFYLSQTPFTKTSTTVFDEEYSGTQLDPTRWSVVDPSSAISVVNGNLQIAGGTGSDGDTLVEFVEQIEMSGALVMQHGDVVFNAPSSAVIGGLYGGTVSMGGCLAGFQIAPDGTQNNIQAFVNGVAAGTPLTTIAGHHYVLTTRLYSQELYRRQQIFHSSVHPAGAGYGGESIAANVRIVLEIHDIDPANPASQVAPATVLYDGEIASAPGFCTYALINAANLECAIAFTELIDAIDTEVRSALPGATFSTLLVGDLSEGAECRATSTELEFFTEYVPAANQQIEVHYRGRGRALARITDPASIAAQQRGIDTGVHGVVRRVKRPPARMAADCENAALAILDDAVNPAWSGQYETWSDFLPGNAADILPGDAMNINAPSREAAFAAVVREVQITVEDLAGEHSRYLIQFATDAANPLSFEFETSSLTALPYVTSYANTQVGDIYIADLTAAQVTQVTSTTVTIDAGVSPPSGGGFEIRWSDEGWGMGNSRNLLGRFSSQTFTLPRLARTVDFFVQQYDASNPPRYSRFSAALHLDYPLTATM